MKIRCLKIRFLIFMVLSIGMIVSTEMLSSMEVQLPADILKGVEMLAIGGENTDAARETKMPGDAGSPAGKLGAPGELKEVGLGHTARPTELLGQTALTDIVHDEKSLQEFVIGMGALYRAIDRAKKGDVKLITGLIESGHDEDGFRVAAVRTALKKSCSPFWHTFILVAQNAGTEEQQAVRREMLVVLAGVHVASKKKQSIGLWSESGIYFQSPLHYVTRRPNAGLITFLFDSKICEPNVLDGVGRTAIFYALTVEIGGQLVSRGVCPLEYSPGNNRLELHPEKVPVGLKKDARGWLVTGHGGDGDDRSDDGDQEAQDDDCCVTC